MIFGCAAALSGGNAVSLINICIELCQKFLASILLEFVLQCC